MGPVAENFFRAQTMILCQWDKAQMHMRRLFVEMNGDLYLAFIKSHRKGTYTTLLTTGRLNEHLYLVDAEAKETVRRLTAEFAKARGIDEKLKATDSLRWVQEMNNCKACAKEAVLESIYG